jgi:hypothetical protein
MKDGFAGPIGKFDEAKAFLGIEPFHPISHRSTRGCFYRRSAEQGSGCESAGLWVAGIGVEAATPRMTEILLSQLWFRVYISPRKEGVRPFTRIGDRQP